jgi:endonuclease V-like protein UPF0215 family
MAVRARDPRRRERRRDRRDEKVPARRASQGDRRAEHRSSRARPAPPINLARALGKRHLRVAAFDDGPFRRRARWAPLAGVVFVEPDQIDRLRLGRVRVDGDDATEAILGIWNSPGFAPGPRAILLDGIAVGGFNVIDMERLARRTGRPVVSLTRRPPELASIRRALRKYFPRSFRRRWARIRARPLFRVATPAGPRYAACAGCRPEDARALLARLIVRGGVPEPLRVARLLAHARADRKTLSPATGRARRAVA